MRWSGILEASAQSKLSSQVALGSSNHEFIINYLKRNERKMIPSSCSATLLLRLRPRRRLGSVRQTRIVSWITRCFVAHKKPLKCFTSVGPAFLIKVLNPIQLFFFCFVSLSPRVLSWEDIFLARLFHAIIFHESGKQNAFFIQHTRVMERWLKWFKESFLNLWDIRGFWNFLFIRLIRFGDKISFNIL